MYNYINFLWFIRRRRHQGGVLRVWCGKIWRIQCWSTARNGEMSQTDPSLSIVSVRIPQGGIYQPLNEGTNLPPTTLNHCL